MDTHRDAAASQATEAVEDLAPEDEDVTEVTGGRTKSPDTGSVFRTRMTQRSVTRP